MITSKSFENKCYGLFIDASDSLAKLRHTSTAWLTDVIFAKKLHKNGRNLDINVQHRLYVLVGVNNLGIQSQLRVCIFYSVYHN